MKRAPPRRRQNRFCRNPGAKGVLKLWRRKKVAADVSSKPAKNEPTHVGCYEEKKIMNETPKNKKGWQSFVRKVFRWLFLVIGAIATFTAGQFLILRFTENSVPAEKMLYTLVNLVAIAFWIWFLFPVIRPIIWRVILLEKRFFYWLFTWRILRRALICCAILATLIAIFYTEEDWRGKRAWENCKRELEAKGAVLDWNKYIPPPVPDDQNFFKASQKIAGSFIRAKNDAEGEQARRFGIHLGPTASNSFPVFDTAKTKPLVVAALIVIPPGSAVPESASNHLFLKLNDTAARRKAGEWLQNTLGRSANGSQGFKFSEFQLGNLMPAQVFVQADALPTLGDMENLFAADTVTNIGSLRIEAAGGNSWIYRVMLSGVRITSAADYLKWSDQYETDFAEIREALKRPYAVIPGDYSEPYLIPIPNFVMMRSMVQTLAQRTQCYLLLGQPENALREMTLMHDMCRILERPPTGKPMSLVEVMVNAIITGLYVATVADGFRLHGWQEPQMAAIQGQLEQINLTPFVAEAFKEEQVHAAGTLQNRSTSEIADLVYGIGKKLRFSEKIRKPVYLLYALVPRGWVYQNITAAANLSQKLIDNFDPLNQQIFPHKLDQTMNEVGAILDKKRYTPFYRLAAVATPNFVKAFQALAYNQTLASQGQIVCGLERYRLSHGEYPETLDALIPQFIEKLPHDLIGGQPLHYRRTEGGKFLLYSVGWNEADDDGQVVLKPDGSEDREKGDWVWQYPAK
jgi:hypothetical protein